MRTEEEKKYVENVLLSGAKNKQIGMDKEYERMVADNLGKEVIESSKIYVQMNRSFKRMAALTLKAVMNAEPVLLVG